jgi:hypothetical protein
MGVKKGLMEQAIAAVWIVGSPGFPVDEDEVRERAGLAYDRSYDPPGLVRQAIAVLA